MVQKRLKSAERRAQLLDVALAEFARQGYGSTTTAGVAEAAGISEPVLYRHFENKRELFLNVVKTAGDRTLEAWSNSLSSASSPVEKIRRLTADFPKLMETIHREHVVIQRATADANDDPELGSLVVEHYKRYVAFLEELIQNGVDAGEFCVDLNIREAAWQLMGPGLAFADTHALKIDKAMKVRVFKSSIETLLDSWSKA